MMCYYLIACLLVKKGEEHMKHFKRILPWGLFISAKDKIHCRNRRLSGTLMCLIKGIERYLSKERLKVNIPGLFRMGRLKVHEPPWQKQCSFAFSYNRRRETVQWQWKTKTSKVDLKVKRQHLITIMFSSPYIPIVKEQSHFHREIHQL